MRPSREGRLWGRGNGISEVENPGLCGRGGLHYPYALTEEGGKENRYVRRGVGYSAATFSWCTL